MHCHVQLPAFLSVSLSPHASAFKLQFIVILSDHYVKPLTSLNNLQDLMTLTVMVLSFAKSQIDNLQAIST